MNNPRCDRGKVPEGTPIYPVGVALVIQGRRETRTGLSGLSLLFGYRVETRRYAQDTPTVLVLTRMLTTRCNRAVAGLCTGYA